MTLFSKAPTFPRGINTTLRERYGVNDEVHDKKNFKYNVNWK